MKNYLSKLAIILMVVGLITSCNQVVDLSAEQESIQEKQKEIKSDLNDEGTKDFSPTDWASKYAEYTGLTLNKIYVGQYDKFQVSEDGYVTYWGMWGDEPTDQDTMGFIQKLIVPDNYDGIIAVVKCDHHTNWGHYQYPDYNETDECGGSGCYGMGFCHHDCFVCFYVRPDGEGFYMAQAIWNNVVDPKGITQSLTACCSSLEDINLLYEEYGYDSTCANLASAYDRKANYYRFAIGKVYY